MRKISYFTLIFDRGFDPILQRPLHLSLKKSRQKTTNWKWLKYQGLHIAISMKHVDWLAAKGKIQTRQDKKMCDQKSFCRCQMPNAICQHFQVASSYLSPFFVGISMYDGFNYGIDNSIYKNSTHKILYYLNHMLGWMCDYQISGFAKHRKKMGAHHYHIISQTWITN